MWSASSSTVTSMSPSEQCRWPDQVLEPAGAGEHDVDAALEAADLRALADAAEDRRAW